MTCFSATGVAHKKQLADCELLTRDRARGKQVAVPHQPREIQAKMMMMMMMCCCGPNLPRGGVYFVLTHSITDKDFHGPWPVEMLVIRKPAAAMTLSHVSRLRCLPPKPIMSKSSIAAMWCGGLPSTSSSIKSLLSSAIASATFRRMLTLASSP